VRIRAAEAHDLPALTDIYNHYVQHSHATFDLEPFTVAQRADWFSLYAPTGPHRLLVGDVDGVVVGYVCSGRFRAKAGYATSVETTAYLQPGQVGKGYGAGLYAELLRQLADEDVHRAYAGIALPNPVSIALHRRLGFEPIGVYAEVGRKFDRFVDVEWYVRRMR